MEKKVYHNKRPSSAVTVEHTHNNITQQTAAIEVTWRSSIASVS